MMGLILLAFLVVFLAIANPEIIILLSVVVITVSGVIYICWKNQADLENKRKTEIFRFLKENVVKILADSIYIIGALIVVLLMCSPIYTEDVLEDTIFMSIFALGIGFQPMLLASIAVYSLHDFKHKKNAIRKSILLFLPDAVCVVCFFVMAVFLLYKLLAYQILNWS